MISRCYARALSPVTVARMESQSTVVCVRLRPASCKETGVRCVRAEGDSCIHFTNPDKSLSAYPYDKVYGEQ